MSHGKVRVVALLATVLTLVAPDTGAESPALVPAPMQLAIFAKVWTLDRTFPRRPTVTVLVVYQRRNRESFNAKQEILAAARGLRGVHIREADVESAPLAATMLSGVDVVYIAPLRSIALLDILCITRASRVRSVTAVREYVTQGVSVGVTLKQNKPSIYINLAAARAEGSDFSSQLLKLAEVVR